MVFGRYNTDDFVNKPLAGLEKAKQNVLASIAQNSDLATSPDIVNYLKALDYAIKQQTPGFSTAGWVVLAGLVALIVFTD